MNLKQARAAAVRINCHEALAVALEATAREATPDAPAAVICKEKVQQPWQRSHQCGNPCPLGRIL